MLITTLNNIWDLQGNYWIVIPTNIGWKSNGENVMGAGLALQAAIKYPELPYIYGQCCKRRDTSNLMIYPPEGLIMFPVKPLNYQFPHLSWQGDASIDMIIESCIQLNRTKLSDNRSIALPLVGCGNGRLKKEDVMPVLHRHLDHRFILVLQENQC